MKHHLLILLRHAEAVSHTASADRLRDLTPHGRAQAIAAGQALAENDLDLSGLHIWRSPAARTIQTAELTAQALPPETPVLTVDQLYDADLPHLLELLYETPENVSALMVVGHNPTIAEACRELAGEDLERPEYAALLQGYPPCMLTAFRITSDWSGLSAGTAELIHCHRA